MRDDNDDDHVDSGDCDSNGNDGDDDYYGDDNIDIFGGKTHVLTSNSEICVQLRIYNAVMKIYLFLCKKIKHKLIIWIHN